MPSRPTACSTKHSTRMAFDVANALAGEKWGFPASYGNRRVTENLAPHSGVGPSCQGV